jgi:hypothetical protein
MEATKVKTRAEALRDAKDESNDLSDVERIILRWQLDDYGDFHKALWQAMLRADEDNLAKLEQGFPREVAALQAWRHTWIASLLRSKGYDL